MIHRLVVMAASSAALLLFACPPTSSSSTQDASNLDVDAGVTLPTTPKEDGGPTTTPDGGPVTNAKKEAEIFVDLRADVNRNGIVDENDPTEDEQENVWSESQGAVFLANIDDDTKRCKLMQSSTVRYPDKTLAGCHDAADEVLNGEDDRLDLSPLRVKAWPEAPDNAKGTLTVAAPGSKYVRIFRDVNGTVNVFDPATATLTAGDLREGVSLLIEGKDITRDLSVWNGYVELTLTVDVPETATTLAGTGSDMVKMRVAPVITFHHNLKAENVYVTQIPNYPVSSTFVSAMRQAVSSSAVSKPLQTYSSEDPWTQDYFEPAYMSKPGPGGTQHVIRVNYRSANIESPWDTSRPLREAGVIVYLLRGKDVAAVQEWNSSAKYEMDSLNSYGNTETIPPYEFNGKRYPLGRLFRGSTPTFFPDSKLAKVFAAQSVQPAVFVDTSWLLVGHVDETISFVKANTPRGWVALVNDARMAKTMLESLRAQGLGNTKMFTGKKWQSDRGFEYPAEITVNAVLNDTDIMTASAEAAAEVDAQVAILKQETGLTDAEIISVPFLHHSFDGSSVAYQPGTVNSLIVNEAFIVAPEPFGPVVAGQDIFKKQLTDAMAPYGYTLRWVDNWDLYHRQLGEVHCGSNTAREIPSVLWWETGR